MNSLPERRSIDKSTLNGPIYHAVLTRMIAAEPDPDRQTTLLVMKIDHARRHTVWHPETGILERVDR